MGISRKSLPGEVSKEQRNNCLDESNPYFHFDRQTKNIRDSVFNCRGIIINERFWNRICNELLDLTREEGPLILYQLGSGYGIEVGMQGKEMVRNTADAVEFLEYYGLLAGWGRFETCGLKPDSKQDRLMGPITVKIFDSFFAHALPTNSGNPGCFFISGMLAGIANGLLDDYHNCLEEKCVSAGADCCQFVITKAIRD